MPRKRTIVIASVAVLAVGAAAAYVYARPLLLTGTGTGYAAHNACAVENIAGRTNPETDLPDNPLVPVLDVGMTPDSDGARASVLGIVASQGAWLVPGYGCTVAPERPEPWGEATVVTAAPNPYADLALTPGTDAELTAAIAHGFGDDLTEQDRAALGTRGMVVLKDGELVAERYADGFDESTPQLGWSMTKSVTNLLVGRYVEQGELSLDDDQLREEWTDGRADITIRHLLQMTSGLAWDETYDLGTPITQMLYDEPDMGAYVASQPLAHEPGTYLQYSSGSTTVLCDIITETRGLADAPRRELFDRLGLASAVMEADATGTPVCSSYMWATPRDWASIGQFALQDGMWNGERLLPEGWIAESTVAVDAQIERGSDGYASGWWANARPDGSLVDPELPADAYHASGHDGQWVIVVPSEDLVIARLGFTPATDDKRFASTAALVIDALR
ncbi:serine hydrolase [Demequina sp. NBRC 110053]|uniref:serine hydrolase domain-containing protein n=1 Tax=Demequina sp. NBRC 110053 TaxID=1570342 RepID=UPI000A049A41|nr:serine hydrolase [Demequina sp. NBRC 110053]